MNPPPRRFLFDEHVHHRACIELVRRGVDVVHALDVGVAAAPDDEVLNRGIAEGRIVITRNYRDFVPLVHAYLQRGKSLPGVLLVSRSLPQSDVGAHVRALERWIASAPPGVNPVANTYGWLG